MEKLHSKTSRSAVHYIFNNTVVCGTYRAHGAQADASATLRAVTCEQCVAWIVKDRGYRPNR